MPKKSGKSKSKRVTLKQKYKVIRKVKEHQRKKRKELRKAGGKPKAPKDPGLPSQWPFKEELIKEFALKRAHILATEKRKKEEKKARRLAAAAGEPEGELAALTTQANAKQEDFETRKRARIAHEFQSDADNSRKAYYKEFRKVVELSDVIIQVLDARDPGACRCEDVERYIRATSPNKRIILLLNKMDLVPREVGEAWLKYYREELPCVAFKCSTQQQGAGLKQGRMPSANSLREGIAGSGCLGADTLLALLKNYSRNAGMKTSITVGVVGLPNVGKSSLINSLKRARVAQVGNTPGVTKGLQEVHLDKHIKLLDSPGVVFADAESASSAALRNAIKVEKLEDPATPVAEILKRVPSKQLMTLYKIAAFAGPDEFLAAVAQARGKLRRGGTPDVRAAAKIVLQDWNDGRIPYYTSPPTRGNKEFASAEVVAAWAKEFNADEVFAAERSAVIAHLPGLDDADGPAFFEAPSAGAGRVAMAELMEDGPDGDTGPPGSDSEAGEDGAAGAGLSGSGEEEEGKDAGPAAMEDDEDEYGAPAKRQKGAAADPGKGGRPALLYSEVGQFDPHAARKQRKATKKLAKKAGTKAQGAEKKKRTPSRNADDGSDFEFDDLKLSD